MRMSVSVLEGMLPVIHLQPQISSLQAAHKGSLVRVSLTIFAQVAGLAATGVICIIVSHCRCGVYAWVSKCESVS